MERWKGEKVEGWKVKRQKGGKLERWKGGRWKGGKVEGGKVERWKGVLAILHYTILYYTIVYYSILYYSISNIRIQQRLLANYIPGDTHNLQRSTGYQFSSVRYYILSYGQKYIIVFKHNTDCCSFFVLLFHLIDSIRNINRISIFK